MPEKRPYNKISALVITLNEEKNIHDLVDNLSFADEIIFVDSFSTDKTIDLLSQYPHVKVYQHRFQNFSDQRNIALDYASNNWVLFIDADERIPNILRDEILTIMQNPVFDAYYLKRTFFFFEKPIKYCGLQTDKNIRLFKKNNVKYHGLVHEKLDIKDRVGILQNYLNHFSFSNYDHFREKIFHYSKLKAIEKTQKGTKPNAFMSIFHPIYNFANRYIWRLGFLDGKNGYIICKIYSEGIQERYKEMKRLTEKK